MRTIDPEICILNAGSGSWAFASLAHQLSLALQVPVSERPGTLNYLLHFEPLTTLEASVETFIPLSAVLTAADKRLIARSFAEHCVAAPETLLIAEFSDVIRHVADHPETEWCLKFPVGCGASGHRMVSKDANEPARWPRPWVLQEFVRLECPEVFRTYCAGASLFGWVARRFSKEQRPSPWVSHARGAHYVCEGNPPSSALVVARDALTAVGLLDSFGCVDLIQRPSGEWLALEVGTDGVFNHVDRELGNVELERELSTRIADAFWRKVAGSGLLVNSVP